MSKLSIFHEHELNPGDLVYLTPPLSLAVVLKRNELEKHRENQAVYVGPVEDDQRGTHLLEWDYKNDITLYDIESNPDMIIDHGSDRRSPYYCLVLYEGTVVECLNRSVWRIDEDPPCIILG